MKFYLDSANLEDIGWALNSGFVTGVTVNQSLLAKEPKQPLMDAYQAILTATELWMDVSFPLTVFSDSNSVLDQAKAIRALAEDADIFIKVPVSRETMPIIWELSAHNIPVNATCIFTGLQAALAAEAGAEILSIFVGRINDDTPGYGWKVIEAARQVCGEAQVLAGSIRDKVMVASAIDHGAHIVTTSRRVLETLAEERGTALSVAKFNADLEAWMA